MQNTIYYYHLLQFTEASPRNDAISKTYAETPFEHMSEWNLPYDTMPVFLRKMVEHAKSGEIMILAYSTKEEGHAVLLTGCNYNKGTKQFEIRIYDENSVWVDDEKGNFSNFYISHDFTEFHTDNKSIPGFSRNNFYAMELIPEEAFEKYIIRD